MFKVILALVTSLNGKLTNNDEPSYIWASKEDQVWFEKLKEQAGVIIMGSKTYESARSVIKLSPKTLRVVMTSQPEKYKSEWVGGQLEFSQLSPTKLLKNLESRGYSSILVVGGAEIAVSFLQKKLLTHLYITLEPLVFSQGLTWEQKLTSAPFSAKLVLNSVKRLNKSGTLLLKYATMA